MLARHFLQQSARQLGVEPKRISSAALSQLATFAFPGNVRQLENICHWLTVMAPAQVIEPKDLPPEVRGQVPAPAPAPAMAEEALALPGAEPSLAPRPAAHTDAAAAVSWEEGLAAEVFSQLASGSNDVWDQLSRRFESRLIQAALASTQGRRIEAAHRLGIGRNTITRKIQELGLE